MFHTQRNLSMSTDTVSVQSETDAYQWPRLFEVEHASLIPVVGAAIAIGSGIEHAWTIAAVLLAFAYLGVYAWSRSH